MDSSQLSRLTNTQKCIAIVIVAYFTVLIVLIILFVGYRLTRGEPESQEVSKFIKNGTKATLGQFPWMVGLRTQYMYRPTCGGSIIALEWVLTANHCVSDSPTQLYVAVAGMINLFYETAGTLHNVVSIHYPKDKTLGESRDIALLRVSPPFEYRSAEDEYENAISPIALPENYTLLTETEGMVAGYGSTDIWSVVNSETLMVANVKLYDYGKCTRHWDQIDYNYTGLICVGDLDIGTHMCRGDSGGPVVVTRNNTPTIVGVNSFSAAAITGCSEQTFTASTSVTYWMNWITRVLKSST